MSGRAFVWHLAKPLLGLNLRFVFSASVLFPRTLAKAFRSGEIVAIVATQLGVMFLITGAGRHLSLALMPFISAVTLGLFLSQLRGVAEHGVREAEDPDGFVKSHSTGSLGKLLLYDVNFNFHKEHHDHPDVPSRHLPALFEAEHGIALEQPTMWRTLKSMASPQ